VSHHETTPELARRFTCFELDQKSATDARCEGKFVLPHIQGAPSASDERAEGERHIGRSPARDAVVVVHFATPCSRSGIIGLKAYQFVENVPGRERFTLIEQGAMS
jgi:hypothetical protein